MVTLYVDLKAHLNGAISCENSFFTLQLAVQQPPEKRIKLVPPTNERIMIYVRQESEDAYTALHLVRTKSVQGDPSV